LVATAHLMTLKVYEALSTGQPYQVDQQPELTAAKLKRLVRHHSRRLRHLNKWLQDHKKRCGQAQH